MKGNKKQILQGLVASLTLGTFAYGVSASAATHTVQAGDTLSELAQKYQTSVDALARLNHLKNVNLIVVGQTLTLTDDVQQGETTQAEDVTTSGATTSSATPTTSSQLGQADAAAKEIIAFRESGGSYTVQNGQYYGRYQLSLSYLNGDLSPENQERVADQYVANRYWSWSAALAFWQANHWY